MVGVRDEFKEQKKQSLKTVIKRAVSINHFFVKSLTS
jgi:hypothetical protein